MSENTGIAWCHHTWNPWIGCNEVSPECKDCYARAIVERQGNDFNILRQTQRWDDVYNWNARAGREGKTSLVFASSMTDFFHPKSDRWRKRAWEVVKECRNLTWLILTKRPERIAAHLPSDWGSGYSNVWLGVTVGVRASYRRIDELRSIPCRLRFLSIEPLLEDLHDIDLSGIGWLLVGGMSGPNWREKQMDIRWAAGLYDKAKAAGIPYLFKQSSAFRSDKGINSLGLYLAEREGVEAEPETVGLVRQFPETDLPLMPINIEKGSRYSAQQWEAFRKAQQLAIN